MQVGITKSRQAAAAPPRHAHTHNTYVATSIMLRMRPEDSVTQAMGSAPCRRRMRRAVGLFAAAAYHALW
jgi:hypothetical protein